MSERLLIVGGEAECNYAIAKLTVHYNKYVYV